MFVAIFNVLRALISVMAAVASGIAKVAGFLLFWVVTLPVVPFQTRVAPLHFAARKNKTSKIRQLLDSGEDIHSRNFGGDTPLHWAAIYNAPESVAALVERGADVNIENFRGVMPIHFAALGNAPNAVATLVECGADVNALVGNDYMHFHTKVLRRVNIISQGPILGGRSVMDWTKRGAAPLHAAAAFYAPAAIDRLVECGANVNARDDDGDTPLHAAAYHNIGIAVVKLIQHGASVNALNFLGQTPLDFAVSRKNKTAIALLRDCGGNIGKDVGESEKLSAIREFSPQFQYKMPGPLHRAAMEDDAQLITVLVNRGENVNGLTADGMPPIFFAVGFGSHNAIVRLARHGANVNADVPVGGELSLMHAAVAAEKEHPGVIASLVRCGGDTEAKGGDGHVPLHFAGMEGAIVAINALVHQGADIEARDDIYGGTPMHWAALSDAHKSIAEFAKHGANVNARAWDDGTPMHWAGNHGYLATISELVKLEADINALDDKGKTPLDWAENSGEEGAAEAAAMLRKLGAKRGADME